MDWLVEALLDGELTRAEAQSVLPMVQVIGTNNGCTRLRAFVFAASMRQAVNDSLDRFGTILNALETRATIVALEVILDSVRLTLPRIPAIVGVAEIQQLLGIKHRQQVDQMAARPNFPKPIAVLIAGRIWLLSDIEAFKATWRR